MTNENLAPNKCPKCGERLAVIQQRSYCPACAMQDALRSDGSSMGQQSLDLTRSMEIPLGGPLPYARDTLRELSTGESFGDYEIISLLGRGGMGIVYEAEHVPTSRRVALKVMTHSWDDHTARARFLREGRLAASINHPNSVYVYGTEEIDGRPAISMELVRGRTLGDWVKSNRPLSPQQAVDAALQIIDGLDAANEAGVLHRDVKPNNCFVDDDGQVKIGDFGLSITTTGRMESGPHQPTMTEVTREGTFLGTPAYASPEQLRGEPLDHRSDIYSVGVTLYYLLSGKVPFAADNMVQLLARVLDSTAPPLKSIAPNMPAELDAIVAQCLRKAPGARYSTYNELRQALLPLGSQAPIAAPLGSRILAAAIDFALIGIALLPFSAFSLFSSDQPALASDRVSTLLLPTVVIVSQVLYFALSEWRFGKTIGKHLLGLQVTSKQSKPTLSAAMVRSALFLLLPLVTVFIADSLGYWQTMKTGLSFLEALTMALLGFSRILIFAAMFVTTRSRNGNASVYDLLTGIRVVVKPVSMSARPSTVTTDSFDTRDADLVGPYHVLNTIGKTDSGELLLGYDARLLRRVWIHRRGAANSGSAGSSSQEIVRDVRRRTQLRWLGGSHTPSSVQSRDDDRQWDCYEGLSGYPIRDIAATSIDWQGAKRVLSDLATEFNAIDDREDGNGKVTLDHCWVTDAGQVKLLPFAVLREPTKLAAISVNDDCSLQETSAIALGNSEQRLSVLRQVSGILEEQFALVGASGNPMSLTEQADLDRLKAANRLADAVQIANDLTRRRAIQVQARVGGMIAASFILPFFSIISLLATSITYDQQEASMPEVRALADAMHLREHSKDASGLSQTERRKAIDQHIRAAFEDVFRDQHRVYSIYGQTQLMMYRRNLVGIFKADRPTDDEAAEAARIFETIRAAQPPRPELVNTFLSHRLAVFLGSLTWVEFIWLPSLFTGFLFRGGALIHLFGLTFVNRNGQRASRLRVFIRMLFSGLLPLAAITVYWSVNSEHFPPESRQAFVAAFIVLAACIAIVAFRSRKRLFSDRCAGTFLVAR